MANRLLPLFDQTFIHLPEYGVVVCKECRYASPPTSSASNLAAYHGDLSAAARGRLVTHIERLPDVALTLDDVRYPDPSSPAFDFLPTVHDAVQCTECPFICQTVTTMHTHLKKTHAWQIPVKRGGRGPVDDRRLLPGLRRASRVAEVLCRPASSGKPLALSRLGSDGH